jgi:hypothetical protein
MQKRFNYVCAIFGMRGTGKTEYFKGNPQHNLPGLIKPTLQQGKKVLIIDTFDHPSYQDIPVIYPEQLKKWKRGVYRCFVRPDDMPQLNKMINELPSMYNTLLAYEDAYKHQAEKLDKTIKELIIDSKQKNIDMLFMYHAFSMAPKDLYRMLDLIQLFKTKDHPSSRKEDMPGYYEEALKVYEEVKKHPSRFYNKLINTEL